MWAAGIITYQLIRKHQLHIQGNKRQEMETKLKNNTEIPLKPNDVISPQGKN
jgi:hypothetical protein